MRRAVLALFLATLPCGAYSALSHEAVIDSVWRSHIVPLLQEKFPDATADDLQRAHAYAYGGGQIQDMGYFPFGSHEFTDLTHYVRSGDFVTALLAEAQNINEYAFAIGALAHYSADRTGHPAINRSVGLIYRNMRRKFGPVVTYEDNPIDHLKAEFGFDVIQVARGLYAPDDYHNFIGFEVAKPVLERAFKDTYGIEITEIFGKLDLGIGTYRFTLGKLVPEMSKVAWNSKRSDIQKLSPGITRARFVYAMPASQYNKDWDRNYHRPGFFARFLSVFFRLIPVFGPFRLLQFKPVPDAAERDFLKSFEETVAQYKIRLDELKRRDLKLADINLDTGEPTHPNKYQMADKTYAFLLDRLTRHQFADVSPELRKNITDYFTPADLARFSKKTISEWRAFQAPAADPR